MGQEKFLRKVGFCPLVHNEIVILHVDSCEMPNHLCDVNYCDKYEISWVESQNSLLNGQHRRDFKIYCARI
jgi:hypothetical protein